MRDGEERDRCFLGDKARSFGILYGSEVLCGDNGGFLFSMGLNPEGGFKGS